MSPLCVRSVCVRSYSHVLMVGQSAAGHVMLSGLCGLLLDERLSFSPLQKLLCLALSRPEPLPCAGCTLGCQDRLWEQGDRWPLGLNSLLAGSRRRRGACTVLPEPQEADARAYGFLLIRGTRTREAGSDPRGQICEPVVLMLHSRGEEASRVHGDYGPSANTAVIRQIVIKVTTKTFLVPDDDPGHLQNLFGCSWGHFSHSPKNFTKFWR